jgi:hypothetical protein
MVMEADTKSDLAGRKVFFLYPSPIVQNEIADELVQQEFEIYVIKDHNKLPKALDIYPDSIVFVNINDQRLSEKEWMTWVLALVHRPEGDRLGVGVLTTTNNDEALQKAYLDSIKITCGFIQVQSDIKKTIAHLAAVLNRSGTKGNRKYLRVTPDTDSKTLINIPIDNGNFVKGSIKDISVVGIACTFEKNVLLERDDLIRDIQIKLRGVLLKAEGVVFGVRVNGDVKTYVIIFTHKVDSSVHFKIRKFIQGHLQSKMDALLK